MSLETISKDVQPYPEKFITLIEAAKRLGLPVFKLRRAARGGAFRTYSIGNRRALVRLTEVVAAIEQAADGGGQ